MAWMRCGDVLVVVARMMYIVRGCMSGSCRIVWCEFYLHEYGWYSCYYD